MSEPSISDLLQMLIDKAAGSNKVYPRRLTNSEQKEVIKHVHALGKLIAPEKPEAIVPPFMRMAKQLNPLFCMCGNCNPDPSLN